MRRSIGRRRSTGRAETRGDLDLGAMAAFGARPAGVAVRNVTRPTFGDGADEVTLARQARAGLALTSGGVARWRR